MKVSVPAYLVALAVAFIFAVIQHYVPSLPVTEDQVMWLVLVILSALGVDVTQALKKQNLL